MKFQFETPRPEERTPIDQETIDKAYQKALLVLSEQIDPNKFAHIYKDVKKDEEFVKQKKRKFAENSKNESVELQNRRKLAVIMEAIIFEQIEQNAWLGPDAVTTRTADYDDIVHGVDAIVEFSEEQSSSHLALALDVTTASRFSEKFAHIKDSIDKEKLAVVKYFESEKLSLLGEKSQIPHVVIGVDKETLFQVMGAWLEGRNRVLATHPIQIKILEEVRVQLEAFKQYAESIRKDNIVRIYDNTLGIIRSIMERKGISEEDARKATVRDNFFKAIKENASAIARGETPADVVAWD